jgi:hypothetical protein
MLRRKLGLKMVDLNELTVKPVPTWCITHSHMARAKANKTIITTNQRKYYFKKNKNKEDEVYFV